MRILFVADFSPEAVTGVQRCAAAVRLGHEVRRVDIADFAGGGRTGGALQFVRKIFLRTGYDLDLDRLSDTVLAEARAHAADLVWLDKVTCLTCGALKRLKEGPRRPKVLLYNPDDFLARFNWSKHYDRCPKVFDLIVTTKSYNVAEYGARGHSRVLFVNNSFDPVEHAPPRRMAPSELRTGFRYDIGFIGGYERERGEMIRGLAERGLTVHVAGSFWDRAGPMPAGVVLSPGDLGPRNYARRIFETKINLAFLRRQNRDLQTTRSFEIPACGGFMLSEPSDELMSVFRPGIEADYFSDLDELHAKCLEYLASEDLRESIAARGRDKVWSGGHTTDALVASVLARVPAFSD